MAWAWWELRKTQVKAARDQIRAWATQFRRLFMVTQTRLEVAEASSAGTKLAIVGPQASGKTFIWTFLRSGGTELVTQHQATIGATRIDATKTVIKTGEDHSVDSQLQLMLADSLDVTGDFTSFSEIWATVLENAFLVVFIFDVSKFVGINNAAAACDYRKLVLDASRFVGRQIQHPDTIVVLALGWCDMLEDWTPTNSAPLWEYMSKFSDELSTAKNSLAVNTSGKARQVDGSLASEEWAQVFIHRIFLEGTRGKGQ